jgi:hypothetical protein
MFAEKYQAILDSENAVVNGLMSEADLMVKNLQSALNNTRAELDAVKSAKCPKCGELLLPNGVCVFCQISKLPSTPDSGFLAGLHSFAHAWVILRRKSLNLNHASFLKVFVDKVYEKRNMPDRLKAAEAVFSELAETNLFRPMQLTENNPAFNDFEKEFGI